MQTTGVVPDDSLAAVIGALVEISTDGAVTASDRVAAAELLLRYGYAPDTYFEEPSYDDDEEETPQENE